MRWILINPVWAANVEQTRITGTNIAETFVEGREENFKWLSFD